MNNKGSLAGLREACQADMLAKVAGMSDKQKITGMEQGAQHSNNNIKSNQGVISCN